MTDTPKLPGPFDAPYTSQDGSDIYDAIDDVAGNNSGHFYGPNRLANAHWLRALNPSSGGPGIVEVLIDAITIIPRHTTACSTWDKTLSCNCVNGKWHDQARVALALARGEGK